MILELVLMFAFIFGLVGGFVINPLYLIISGVSALIIFFLPRKEKRIGDNSEVEK